MIKRKILQAAVAATLLEIGFDSAEQLALETLTELLQSYIVEIGNSSKSYCELAGRTEPIFADVLLSLVNMGLKVSEMEQFAKRENKAVIPPPLQMTQQKQLNMLQAGIKLQHPPHIPTHLPLFPDPHAYIRTPTHKQPVTEYEAIREKAAEQKRDLERALNRFIAKTGDTDSLFTSPDSVFPLIGCKGGVQPYLIALLPKDQIFEFEDEYSPHHVSSPARKTAPPLPPPPSATDTAATKDGKEALAQVKKEDNVVVAVAVATDQNASDEQDRKDNSIVEETIDNPYLRPAKIPPPKIKIKDLLGN